MKWEDILNNIKPNEKGYIHINNYTTYFCLKCYKYIIYINNSSNSYCPLCNHDKTQNVFYAEAQIYFEKPQQPTKNLFFHDDRNSTIIRKYYEAGNLVANMDKNE